VNNQSGDNSIKVSITKDERRINGWVEGKATGGITFCAKVFDKGSQYGINNGCISKLDIRQGRNIIVNYDRGWDVKPQTPEVKEIYKLIMTALNTLGKVSDLDKPKDLLGKIEENKQKVAANPSEKREKTKEELC
jgi:hypothetical protein